MWICDPVGDGAPTPALSSGHLYMSNRSCGSRPCLVPAFAGENVSLWLFSMFAVSFSYMTFINIYGILTYTVTKYVIYISTWYFVYSYFKTFCIHICQLDIPLVDSLGKFSWVQYSLFKFLHVKTCFSIAWDWAGNKILGHTFFAWIS